MKHAANVGSYSVCGILPMAVRLFAMQGYACRLVLELALTATVAGGLFACAGPADSAGRQAPWESPGDNELTIATYIDARPAALVDGRVVQWGELRPLLNEAAGATILQEVILDRMLQTKLDRIGITINDNDLDRERQLFFETLSPDPDVAARLARELRARQGLGRQRLNRLLRRNAGLRAMVRDQVVISEESVFLTYEVQHGPTRRARLMVLPTLASAQAAIDRVTAGDFFGDVAVEVSTDASAARGGLLARISRVDPTYPEAMREALWVLEPGAISAPILLSREYAVLMLVEEVDGDGVSLKEVRSGIERQVRLTQERLLMDQEARRLLSDASVTIIDAALKESWDFSPRKRPVP